MTCILVDAATPQGRRRRWDVKRLLTVILAGVVLGGVFASTAEAGDRRGNHRRNDARHYRDYDRDDYKRYRGRAYYRPRDIVVIRDHYRP